MSEVKSDNNGDASLSNISETDKNNSSLNREFELRKKDGFGHFVLDKSGKVIGVAIANFDWWYRESF